MKYSVIKQDSAYYIIAIVRFDRMTFLNKPTMKIRTFNNKVITLEGTVIGSGSEFSGIVSGSIIISVTEITSTVQFPITPEEFELLNNDVSVRLSMAPKTMKKRSIKTRLEKNYINYI